MIANKNNRQLTITKADDKQQKHYKTTILKSKYKKYVRINKSKLFDKVG